MGGGGKGGTTTTKVELPKEMEMGATGALGGALQSAGLEYSPNRGVTIAGFAPQQQAAQQGANSMALALGLPTGDGQYLPPAQQTAGGFQGYSTGGLYDANIAASMTPEQQAQRAQILQQYSQLGSNISNGVLGGSTYDPQAALYGQQTVGNDDRTDQLNAEWRQEDRRRKQIERDLGYGSGGSSSSGGK